MKKIAREQRIPFDISNDPFYSESNMNYIKSVVDGVENGTIPLIEHDLIDED